jgi:KaiC/GvpD/RAD55 family RecA-like ATPase
MSFTLQVTLFRPQSRNFDVETRLQALTLVEHDIAIKIVQAVIEMIIRIISELKRKARSREYDSKISRVLKLEYVTDASRSDKSSKITSTVETIILINVRADRNEREKCFARLSYEHEISSITILRVLKRNEFRSCKSIMKLDLNAIMMKARLQFCLRHKN